MTIECSQSVHSIVLRSGIRGLSAILSKVQIHLRDLFQRRKNLRNQNARRLDAVQTENGFALRLFITSIEERGTANEETQ